MKKSIILLLGILLLISFPSSIAFTIESDVSIEPTASNTRYNFSTNYTLSRLEVQSTTLYFNGNIFRIEADSGIVNVTIHNLNSMSFTVEATDTVIFVLGGFSSGVSYVIEVDGSEWRILTADSQGKLQFEYSSWSSHLFTISTWLSADVTPRFVDAVGMISNLLISVVIIVLLVFVIGIIFGKGVSVNSFAIFIDIIIVMVLLFVLILIVMSISSIS